jgi:hypothetical protein
MFQIFPRPWCSILLMAWLASVSTFVHASDSRALAALLDGVLAAHVDKGYIDYPKISRNVRFHKYIEALADLDVESLGSDEEQIAFWLNVYNALAIKNVIDGITPLTRIGRLKFFRTTEHPVGGRDVDLNSIDDILMKFGDPRIRLAMVHAAYTGPDLPAGAYRADQIDQQLTDAARRFVNDNRKNRYSQALFRTRISQLFERHSDEFGENDAEVLAYISQYVDDEEIATGLREGRYELKYLDYEWGINGSPM